MLAIQILCTPSSALASRMASEEKERVKMQADALGEDGLKRKKEEFEQAVAKNEVNINLHI